MNRLSAVVVLVGLAVVVGALALGQASSSSPKKIFESAIVGVPEGMTGVAGTIRGVNGAGAPWVVSDGQARLDADGRLRVEVEGLVLAGSFTNPVANIRASLTCEGTNVVATTGAVPLSVPDGDAKIDEMISLPASCVGPIVLVRISGAAGPGSWLAATGAINAPAFKADPFAFDPDDTNIVVGDWVHHLGLNDAKGEARDGLLLSKGGATSVVAAAGAEIKRAEGITLTHLGFDIRSGGHCGAGAPRFNVVVDVGGSPTMFFFGCSSGTQSNVPGVPSTGWKRVRFSNANAVPADGVTAWPGF